MERQLKDSGIPWIGEIPEHWSIARIKDKYLFQTGATPPSKTESYYDGNHLWANIGDLNGKTLVETSKHLSDEGVSVCSMSISPKGSLLYSFKLSVGQVAFCGVDMYTNEAIATFIGNESELKYLYYIAPIFIILNANENIYGAPILNQELIKNALIPVPPLSEQEAIAAYLDKKCGEIDELIEVEQQMIFDLEAYRQAVISEVVTKGLSQNMDFKFSGYDWIGYIPVNWDVKRLRFIGSTQNGISKEGSYFGSGSPFVNYGDVYNNIFLPKRPINLCKSDKTDQDIYSVKYGDVFFTRTSETIEEIGFSAACRETIDNAVFSGFLIRFRPDARILKPEYAGYYFRSKLHREFFVKEMNIVTRASLGQNLLRNIPVLIPHLEEQLEIADYLDAKCAEIDELIKVKQEKIETLKQYRQSLIFEAVTGKINISV